MGNYSFLRAVRNNPDQCIIDWSKIDLEEPLHWRIQDMVNLPEEERPKTLADLAERRFDESKLFGYMTTEQKDSLGRLCKVLKPYGANPRLYFTCEGTENMYCLEFIPGTGKVNAGVFNSDAIIGALPKRPDYDSAEYQEWDSMYRSVKKYLDKYCIDAAGWRFERIVS